MFVITAELGGLAYQALKVLKENRQQLHPELLNTASNIVRAASTQGLRFLPNANKQVGPALYGLGHKQTYQSLRDLQPYYGSNRLTQFSDWFYDYKPWFQRGHYLNPRYSRENKRTNGYFKSIRARYRSERRKFPYARPYRSYSQYRADKSRRSRYPFK